MSVGRAEAAALVDGGAEATGADVDAARAFLLLEAELLDDQRFDEWLELLTEDVDYRAPIRTTAKRGHPDVSDDMFFFEENIHTLRLRVRRLHTDVAWAEDPPSRTRHFVTNVRVRPGERPGELAVRSNLLLYRNRGNDPGHDLLSAERRDQLRREGAGWRLARRRILLDQATLGTKNLAVFL